MATYDNQGFFSPGFDYPYQPSPLYSASTISDLTLIGDQQFTPPAYYVGDISPRPAKRQRMTAPAKELQKERRVSAQMTPSDSTGGDADAPAAAVAAAAAVSKPKRVRTGCLTCRERHLKCDEGLPNCQNCRKSSRTCKRGVRLNFIDTTVKSPPMIPPTADWRGMSSLNGRDMVPC